ncbi:MAG: WYL domain-containing protein [Clostridia bacterium]|nr:WYL domain-containing protein [Clostridia bacterium]
MARSERQKEKLYRLIEIFMRETDDTSGLTVKEIISALSEYGIKAERKSIYDDLLTLGELGFDIVTLPKRPPEYTLANRLFSLAELKLLTDAVESSRFVSREKSREIIDKLRLFAGKRRSGELSRQVYVEDRVKSIDGYSFDNIDLIHKAINGNKKISFGYFDYTVSKKRELRHGGKRYVVSPISLIMSDGNYYLVAYDSEAEINKNFRVDKISEPRLTGEARDRRSLEERFNPAKYSQRIFGMYGGREELVTLECREHLAGVIIDRFGDGYSFIPTDFGFSVAIRVMVSPNFFAWVLGFGKDMRILRPDAVREEMVKRLAEISEIYKH